MTYKTTVFQGLGDLENHTIPEWYREKQNLINGVDRPTFKEAIQELPKATAVTPAYYDEEREEFIRVEDKTALVNPAWLGDGLDTTPEDHGLWAYAGSRYTPVNPMDMYGPLIAMARKHELTNVYGQIEQYQRGGEVHIDFILPDYDFEADGIRYVMALTTGYSHTLNRGLYMRLTAVNTESGAEWRRITDANTCRHHKGAVKRTAKWWEKGLTRADTATHDLAQVVDEAMHYTIPLKEMPYNLEGFYVGLGVPEGLAEIAAGRVKNKNTEGEEPEEATALALYEGISETLTHEWDGKTDGTAAARHNRKANQILFSPPSAESKVINYWRVELSEQEEVTMEDELNRRALGTRYGDCQAAIEHYEDTKESLKRILKNGAGGTEEDDGEEDGGEEVGVEA